MKYVFLELIGEEPGVLEEGENGSAEIAHVRFGHLSAHHLFVGLDTLATGSLFALLFGLINGQALPFLLLHALNFSLLTLVQISVMVLLSLHEP